MNISTRLVLKDLSLAKTRLELAVINVSRMDAEAVAAVRAARIAVLHAIDSVHAAIEKEQ